MNGDDVEVRAIAEAIAGDERAKRHTGVADRIVRVLETKTARSGFPHSQPRPRVRDGSGGILRRQPRRSIDDLHLDPRVRSACDELVEEQRRADVLRASGLEPRHRVLLAGPPGNGKTSLAEALAFELALPLFTVRYDAVVTSYLGETAQRLRRLFDFVRTEPCVLFFDEFDAIGKERGDIHETGEIKRVVTTLLLQMDDLPSYCVLVGATNHPELLDRATWRRFEICLELCTPSPAQLIKYFARHLSGFQGRPGYTAKRLSRVVNARSFSEAEEFFMGVRRCFALAQGTRELRSIIDDRVKAIEVRSYRPKDRVKHGRTTDTPIP